MHRKKAVAIALAMVGAVLVWFPILAPAVISVSRLMVGRVWRFDYLMPAELFPAAVLGGGLLLWAALRARSHRRIIGWGLGSAVALLIGGQALAVATGLASGDIAPAGWPWVLVLASLGGYTLALVGLGVGGVLLLRELLGSA